METGVEGGSLFGARRLTAPHPVRQERSMNPPVAKLQGHWRAGHWRRQAFGEGSLQRKLIWIQPYKTAGLDA